MISLAMVIVDSSCEHKCMYFMVQKNQENFFDIQFCIDDVIGSIFIGSILSHFYYNEKIVVIVIEGILGPILVFAFDGSICICI